MSQDETMKQIVLQEWIEERFNRKHIDTKIREAIEAQPAMMAKVEHGVQLITEYINKPHVQANGKPFVSKMQRIAQLKGLDVNDLVMDCFVGIAYSVRDELFTSVTAKMSARLNFSDRTEAITTVAEMLALLCATDAFDINKLGKLASLTLVSRIPLPDDLLQFMEDSQYLPPMVCEPLPLTHNHSSGYLTHNDSLILGSGNHHDGDICLDVLNTMNRVAFKLDLDFLCQVEEEPSEITVEKLQLEAAKKGKYLSDAYAKERVRKALENWDSFKAQSYRFYSLMQRQGNRFYMTNKVDKRGRIYSCGYHINPQGAAFKKAQLELARESVVEGVPS